MRVSAGFEVTTLSGKMRIQTLPPRLRWWVMVRRAASIWRAVIHAGSSVRIANSPKAMVLPRSATPPRPPWGRFIILRCFMRFGCSMAYSSVRGGGGAEAGGGGRGGGGGGGAWGAGQGAVGGLHHFAMLHALWLQHGLLLGPWSGRRRGGWRGPRWRGRCRSCGRRRWLRRSRRRGFTFACSARPDLARLLA